MLIIYNQFLIYLKTLITSKILFLNLEIKPGPDGNLKLTYVTGQRGMPKLVIDGYSFVRNKGTFNSSLFSFWLIFGGLNLCFVFSLKN